MRERPDNAVLITEGCCEARAVLFNPLTTTTPDFGRMLSVGAIRFEDGFCASRNGGTVGGGWVHRSG